MGSGHAGSHTVCGNCIESTKNAQWYKLARTRIEGEPPRNIGINDRAKDDREPHRWRGARARICRLCEQREQHLIYRRQGYVTVLPLFPDPSPEDQALMQHYPENTCTCLKYLESSKRCGDHRREQFNSTRAWLRNINREWLRTSVKARHSDVLWTAGPARLKQRKKMTNGCTLRACRCRREVIHDQEPEVLHCMACEGIIQITPWTPAYHTRHPPLRHKYLVNSATPVALDYHRDPSPNTR